MWNEKQQSVAKNCIRPKSASLDINLKALAIDLENGFDKYFGAVIMSLACLIRLHFVEQTDKNIFKWQQRDFNPQTLSL